MTRLGLRARVTLLFSAGALLLSTALAVTTYHVTAQHLISERERTAVRGAYFDSAVVGQGLASDRADVVQVLRALDTGQNRKPLLWRDGAWYARGADDGLTEAVPDALLRLVAGGRAGLQRTTFAGEPALVVGIPLAEVDNSFFEVQLLTEVQSTLTTLSGTLSAVALAVTIAAAGLSRWTAGRVLRPLHDVTQAATRVSRGDLTVRMDSAGDPDLDGLTTAFNRMVREVSERIQRDQRFAADVSHELRSPLQTLAAASSVLLRSSDRLDSRTAKAAHLVAEESARFAALVQDLLEISRAELPPELAPVDIADLVSRVCSRANVPPGMVHITDDVTTWTLDERRVEQLLTNLLENAERYGGGLDRISVSRADRRLTIEVDDRGPGIPFDERERVFDRFARGRAANARGAREGTGLGLALVAQHAATHGGTAHILDRPGGGCRVRVELPQGREV
jgi:two-component system, OmpR family, sensor histidine kinase MtrB